MAHFDRPVLMWVTDRIRSDAPLPDLAQAAAGAGIDLIQVREPALDQLALELLVRGIMLRSGPSTRVIVNSNITLARKLGVGVHLPERGATIEEARRILGPDALVGRSVHSAESARQSEGASYLIAGHVFETASKEGRRPIGLEGLGTIVDAAPAPVLAIGGMTPGRASAVLATGAAGMAIMSPLTQRSTIRERVEQYRSALEQSVTDRTGPMITATINGKPTELSVGTTISAFLAGRDLHERLVVVERNGEIVKRPLFSEVVIEEGDLLEIVHFVGGG